MLLDIQRLIRSRFVEERLAPKLAATAVSPEEVRCYYEAHQEDYATPAVLRAALIRIAVANTASGAKRDELRARADSLRLPAATATFGSVAVKYSDDQATRYRGGDTGWVTREKTAGRWPQLVDVAIFSLARVGEIAPIIAAEDGFYLVKLVERRESEVPAFERVMARIEHELLQEKKRAVEEGFLAEIAAQVSVTIDERVVADYLAAQPLPNPSSTVEPGPAAASRSIDRRGPTFVAINPAGMSLCRCRSTRHRPGPSVGRSRACS